MTGQFKELETITMFSVFGGIKQYPQPVQDAWADHSKELEESKAKITDALNVFISACGDAIPEFDASTQLTILEARKYNAQKELDKKRADMCNIDRLTALELKLAAQDKLLGVDQAEAKSYINTVTEFGELWASKEVLSGRNAYLAGLCASRIEDVFFSDLKTDLANIEREIIGLKAIAQHKEKVMKLIESVVIGQSSAKYQLIK